MLEKKTIMKILHVISQAPDFTGSGKYVQAVLKCAAVQGHDNFLVAGVQGEFALDSSIIQPEKTLFVRFDGKTLGYPLPGMSDVMPYKSSIFSMLTLQQANAYEKAFEKTIRKAVAVFNPDIIHSHHLWIVSSVACRAAPEVPIVATCHGTCLRQHSLCRRLGEKAGSACRKICRIMALSNVQKQEIMRVHKIPGDRIDVVGGGYNDDLFYYEEKLLDGPVELLYAGKLSSSKGVPWLLEALRKVKTGSWRLHLAGEGSGTQKQHCLDLAEAFGDKVVVHGALSHEDLALLMRKSHVFVLPSFFEGLPLVLLEALASGCRVVTTSLPGTREVLGCSGSSMVKLIDLPVLETIDSPFTKDLADLENSLAEALDALIDKVRSSPEPDLKTAQELAGQYRWGKVFSRIERVYQKAKPGP